MGEKPRLTINAREAVRLFRSGMSDEDLMRRYNISARSLERLFKKLVDEGEIAKAELNHRLYRSHRSHVVDVVSDATLKRPGSKKKIKISAGDVLSRLKSGMSDIELMDQYNLSSRGLHRLLGRLVTRGDISEDDLEQRKRAFQWVDIAFVRSNGQSPETLDEKDLDAEVNHTAIRAFLGDRKVIISGVLGALCGVLASAVFLVSFVGLENARKILQGPNRVTSTADGSVDRLDDAAKQVISTLESIARRDPGTINSDSGNQSPEYEMCMKNCDKDYAGGDDADKVIWINCRKNCVARHSKRLREIRALYHRPALW